MCQWKVNMFKKSQRGGGVLKTTTEIWLKLEYSLSLSLSETQILHMTYNMYMCFVWSDVLLNTHMHACTHTHSLIQACAHSHTFRHACTHTHCSSIATAPKSASQTQKHTRTNAVGLHWEWGPTSFIVFPLQWLSAYTPKFPASTKVQNSTGSHKANRSDILHEQNLRSINMVVLSFCLLCFWRDFFVCLFMFCFWKASCCFVLFFFFDKADNPFKLSHIHSCCIYF